MDSRNKVCVLLLDEMSLKSTVTFDPSRHVIVSFENFGHVGTETALSNNAVVFMVRVCVQNGNNQLAISYRIMLRVLIS